MSVRTIHRACVEASYEASSVISWKREEFDKALDRLIELHCPNHTSMNFGARLLVCAEFFHKGPAERFAADLQRLFDSYDRIAVTSN